MRVIPGKQLKQYREYLKGFYYHINHNLDPALYWYTESLSSGGMYSLNYLRLHALKAIELVVNERKIYGNNSPIKRLGERRAT